MKVEMIECDQCGKKHDAGSRLQRLTASAGFVEIDDGLTRLSFTAGKGGPRRQAEFCNSACLFEFVMFTLDLGGALEGVRERHPDSPLVAAIGSTMGAKTAETGKRSLAQKAVRANVRRHSGRSSSGNQRRAG